MSTVCDVWSRSLSAFTATALVVLATSSLVVAPAQAAPGELDVSIGGDGKQTTDFGGYDHGSAVAIQDDTTTVNGRHSFSVRATDPAGNTDPSPATRSFTVDTTITSGPRSQPTAASRELQPQPELTT